MSSLSSPTPSFYFASIIYNKTKISLVQIKEIWETKWGVSEEFFPEFNPSLEYYAKEMGPITELERLFLVYTKPCMRELLVESKVWATQVEVDFMLAGKRVVNLDIGMLNLESLILATGKPYSHRIYLSLGVWADLTLMYQAGTYSGLPWSYADYTHKEKIQYFNTLRKKLLVK
jgi:hypothetical protein